MVLYWSPITLLPSWVAVLVCVLFSVKGRLRSISSVLLLVEAALPRSVDDKSYYYCLLSPCVRASPGSLLTSYTVFCGMSAQWIIIIIFLSLLRLVILGEKQLTVFDDVSQPRVRCRTKILRRWQFARSFKPWCAIACRSSYLLSILLDSVLLSLFCMLDGLQYNRVRQISQNYNWHYTRWFLSPKMIAQRKTCSKIKFIIIRENNNFVF